MLNTKSIQDVGSLGLLVLVLILVVVLLSRSYNSFHRLKSNYGITVGKVISIRHSKGYSAEFMYEVDGKSYGGTQGITPDTNKNCLYIIAFELGNPVNSYLNFRCEKDLIYGMRLDRVMDSVLIDWRFLDYQTQF